MKKLKGSIRSKLIIAVTIVGIICIVGFVFKTNQSKAVVVGKTNDKEFEMGSKIKIDKLSKTQEQNLFKLCKVWGFLKYYHPEVAKGNINWDYELFSIMPKILNESNNSKVDKILCEWVKGLGEVKKGEYKTNSDKVIMEPSTGWIKDTKFISSDLSKLLCKIQTCKRTGENYYVSFKSAGNPDFSNEKLYDFIKYGEDQGYRLLTLFRYWNCVEYYFPYKNIMDHSWDSVLTEFIPKMIESNDELKYRLSLYEFIGKVQDEHAGMWKENNVDGEFFGKNIAAIDVNMIEDKLVVTKKLSQLNSDSNIKIGDVILKINGKNVEDLIKEKLKYIPKANKKSYRYGFMKYLIRTNDKELNVVIQRGSETSNEKINCIDILSSYSKDWRPSHELINGNIGYIYPEMLNKGEVDSIMEKFKGTEGLIVDLRCYPSDFIVYSLGKYLMEKPTEFVRISKVNKFMPGQFIGDTVLSVGENNNDYYKGKVIIIINENTMSQPEFTTMAFRCAPKATVIGSNSVGADGDASEVKIAADILTKFSGTGIYYPDGRETQRIGIIPDIEVKPTIEGIRAGKDELLDRAIELIKSDKN